MTALARHLARYTVETRFGDLPEPVRREGPRALLNWIGCVYGGLGEPAVDAAMTALGPSAGPGAAVLIGRARHVDPASAAFFNVLASSVHGFDDAHLPTIAHPSPPAAAAALAVAQMVDAPGAEILAATLLGIELQCRIATALVAGGVRLGFHMTGLTGAMGATAAAGRILGLDTAAMTHAIGIAAAAGAGFRETHASMANFLIKAQATRAGVTAALLARAGFTCAETALEGDKGFFAVFGDRARAAVAIEGLGTRFELLRNAYKPYPAAIPVNPVIDACLDIAAQLDGAKVDALELTVNPLALQLAGRRAPETPEAALNSLYHWAAVALLRNRATPDDCQSDSLADAAVLDLSRHISATGDETVARESARAIAHLSDGRTLSTEVRHARGSAERHLADDELHAKYAAQAARHLDPAAVNRLADACRDLGCASALSATGIGEILARGHI